ncbi:hypothetical protein AB0I49_02210 [Streptomyces sp. NPDC050617]|uniref:hypothetical protein n=1 Tax=Streptomyces sp. NPDC050617 TaxID=3154628 RepID=UPI003423F5D9
MNTTTSMDTATDKNVATGENAVTDKNVVTAATTANTATATAPMNSVNIAITANRAPPPSKRVSFPSAASTAASTYR